MKTWYSVLKAPLNTYNPRSNEIPASVRLSGNLSPLTNFFLNIFVNSIGEKNFIIGIPSNVLRPIPILAYLYATIENKSVVVFTQRGGSTGWTSPIDFHNMNYHLMNEQGNYIFNRVPMGIMSDEGIDARPYIPRAKRVFKQRLYESQKRNFLNSEGAKIILYSDIYNSRLVDTIKKITLTDDETLDHLNIEIDPGLIIFENVDRFAYSDYYFQLFLAWISPLLESKKNILFHFSNPTSPYVQRLKDATNSLAIPFGHSILRSNEEFKKESINYFNSRNDLAMPFLNNYLVDPYEFYEQITDIKILEPPLESGNIDYYYRAVKSLRSKVDESILKNKGLYYKILMLAYKLPNLSINPSKYKECFGDKNVAFRQYTIPQLLSVFRDYVAEESEQNRSILIDLISEIFCMYSELKECKRFEEEGSYTRIAKDYKILEEIKIESAANSHYDSKIIVATFSPMERNILEGQILNDAIIENCEVKTIKQINQSLFNKSNTTLFLPGPLRMKFRSELLRPYMKIVFVAYDGENYLATKDQIDRLSSYSFEQEQNSMICIGEAYDFLGLKKDGLFKDYYERITRIKLKAQKTDETQPPTLEEVKKQDINDIFKEIKDTLSTNILYDTYKQREDELISIENSLAKIEEERTEEDMAPLTAYYTVVLSKVNNVSFVKTLKLPINKTYFFLDKLDGILSEGTPRNLKEEYFVIILDNDERKTILELIFETSDLEESIEKYWIESWKARLAEFIENNNLSYSQFHRLYKDAGGNRDYQTVLLWAKGGVIGPENKMDLFTIGKILADKEIMEDYEKIDREVDSLRQIHRSVGRNMRKIIKAVMTGNIDPEKLSYDELILYEKIKDGVYKIEKITKCDNNLNNN
ncbi:MAG: hypothetical protein MUO82_11105 [Candidatus Thermoplasmatota archaeon]|nr:hypothetical protein [Candidatus Thermoplasmatota archaeon]